MAEQTAGLGGYPTIFCIQVADVAEAIAKAVGLGGKTPVGPVTIPTGSFGWIGMWTAAA